VEAEQKFRADGDHPGERKEPCRVRAQQEAEREPGDQRRAQVKPRQAEPARTRGLGRKRARNSQRAVERLGAEIDPDKVDDQQAGEGCDLVVACVGPEWRLPGARYSRPHGNSPRDWNRSLHASPNDILTTGSAAAGAWPRNDGNKNWCRGLVGWFTLT